MLRTTPTARLAHILTDEDWNKAKRNSAARQIANMRAGIEDDPVVEARQPIVQNGVVGRYDRGRAELLCVIAEASGCAASMDSEQYQYQGTRRRYSVQMFGHQSDIDRACQLYEDLLSLALAELMQITGEQVLQRRRAWFADFVAAVSKRLRDVGAAPGMQEWLKEHHEHAYTACEAQTAK